MVPDMHLCGRDMTRSCSRSFECVRIAILAQRRRYLDDEASIAGEASAMAASGDDTVYHDVLDSLGRHVLRAFRGKSAASGSMASRYSQSPTHHRRSGHLRRRCCPPSSRRLGQQRLLGNGTGPEPSAAASRGCRRN